MRVKRIVFVNRAPFGELDIDLSNNQVISLTGINGSGKTTVLSYIVDAFHEIARKAYHQEFSGIKEDKLYRVSSELYNMNGATHSMVYISFDMMGKEVHYVDFLGAIDNDIFNNYMSAIWKDIDRSNWPIKFNQFNNQLQHGARYAKYVSIDESDAREVFSKGLLTYFPSYRYEEPGYLNDVFHMELMFKYRPDFSGYLTNPIEVTSDLPQIANWMMDIVLDKEVYGSNEILLNLQQLVSEILSYKHKRAVRIGIGQRNLGGARIQIVDSVNGFQVYPTIFNLSAGEASLLCIFGELIRQTDRLGKKINDVEGIVLVDEIDKHLHILLQKEVIPVLVQMFPKVQFVFTTHSAFVNIGLTDSENIECSVRDLDNNGIECASYQNDVFREAYNVMTEENNRYVYFYNSLSEKIASISKPIVYLEGRTDEKYFKKALDAFEYDEIGVDFQWIGHMDESGNETFTGSKSLDQGMNFIRGRNPKVLHFFLFDCDTNKQEDDENNIVVMVMPYYSDHDVMNKGIENALELGDINIEQFYEEYKKNGDYGKITIVRELDKMKMCDYICALDNDSQRKILKNLKPIIDTILDRINRQGQ